MTTFTKEQLIEIIKRNITVMDRYPDLVTAQMDLEVYKIALASLEAEPVAYIFKHPAGKLFWALTDESNKEQPDVIPVYAAPPVPVVPEEKPMPNALSMLEREITQLIGDAQEATVTGYELIAEAWRLMDGQDPKTSDWHSKASKYLNSNIVEKVDDDRIEAVKAVLRRLAGNSPVIPGEVLSAIMKVARVRADFDDFDGDRRGIGDCLDEAEQELIVTINKYASQLAAEPIATNDVREQQTAVPPVPEIQADVAQAIENLKQKLVECNRYNYCADAVKGVEDACHAAMLQGIQPVSQTYKFPVNTPCQDAPAHIWLQTAGVWPEDGELSELTWCSHNQHHDDTLYVRADLVNGNSPVTPDSWISCSDQMPEKGQNVLISVNFDSSLVEPLICSARYTGSTFRRGDATIKPGNGIEQATHWMPLPEPPQEVK
ncbi:TPA: DUF551 domain-containing protein [Escherichia coli]|nr:DUF551 domain-containing protein [Escherichia coli]HCN8001029.1 DUF551 domain-containing protein [Escherichia coli]HCN8680044.1 DUF551 domain-containing protein [Escherichia coli]HCN9370085.1 DUF551 domain-containing protein [Escherichia coli]HCO0000340.1 DUF551 domain-containing protein [Escherichia coli]